MLELETFDLKSVFLGGLLGISLTVIFGFFLGPIIELILFEIDLLVQSFQEKKQSLVKRFRNSAMLRVVVSALAAILVGIVFYQMIKDLNLSPVFFFRLVALSTGSAFIIALLSFPQNSYVADSSKEEKEELDKLFQDIAEELEKSRRKS